MLLNKDNNVKKFVITVENFCNLVDNGKQIEKRDFFKTFTISVSYRRDATIIG